VTDALPKPLYRRILVRRDNPDELTASGLLRIPDPEKKSCGTVIAVNDGHTSNEGAHLPCESKVGDRVLFGKYSGTDIDGADFGMPQLGKLVVMPESEVLLTLPPGRE
jgi:chaperonin GroES